MDHRCAAVIVGRNDAAIPQYVKSAIGRTGAVGMVELQQKLFARQKAGYLLGYSKIVDAIKIKPISAV